MMDARYRPHDYWQERLTRRFDLAGVGLQSKGRAYNRWAYRLRAYTLSRALDRCRIEARGKRVLDVGSGTGFYVDFWHTRGAQTVTGLDITEKSVSELRRRFPRDRFEVQDIGRPLTHNLGRFDVVGVFDVLFHITDDRSFDQAIANLQQLVAPGGSLVLTDILGAADVGPRRHVRMRSRARYAARLRTCGFRIHALVPQFFLFYAPLALRSRQARTLLYLLWEALTLPARFEPLGEVTGLLFYIGDGALSQIAHTGLSTQLLIAEATVQDEKTKEKP